MEIKVNPTSVCFQVDGLIPAIVQDARTREVLTLAYMNRESLDKTLETGETWFYSRSRQELWHKGATSGNTQQVQEVRYDCDQDAILLLVTPQGPACHTGATSCFVPFDQESLSPRNESSVNVLQRLERTIAEREQLRLEGAYTTYLFEKGIDKILKKVGEETTEVVIAAKNESHDELRYETADLLYHLLVLLRQAKLPLGDVLQELEKRMK